MKWIRYILIVTILINLGCTDEALKEGCTFACASNYDPGAESENGTCRGCTDTSATNYCPGSVFNDGSCISACEANQTAIVYFINDSNTESTYDIIWDGSVLVTVLPGQESADFTVTANITHSLQFRFTNSSNNACTASSPIIPQCQRWWFNCTG